MKFFSTLKAERCLTQLLAERDPASPERRKALESLRDVGADAIPKIIDAFSGANKDQSAALVSLLAALLDDRTFPLYAAGLGHGDKVCVSGVTKALAASGNFDT